MASVSQSAYGKAKIRSIKAEVRRLYKEDNPTKTLKFPKDSLETDLFKYEYWKLISSSDSVHHIARTVYIHTFTTVD
jgi:hypothetical protein